MELKRYQESVINDLSTYLNNVLITGNPSKAYQKLWNDKQVRVGFGGMPSYKDTLGGVPSVCLKVPTGGGKTVLACASLKAIFDRMSPSKKKVVVWLVPWETILTQTYNTLTNPNHFYRQRLDRDFSSKIEIYNKEQALNGENFNPLAIDEQLSIVVMSFDSLRSKKKDGRKVYETNSALAPFVDTYEDNSTLVDEIDDTALIQVLNQCNPVVVIDESHNAKSDLSLEMVKNLNPSFVLELTATPKKDSNIISIVSAEKLKEENMVKLPVIAYNRPNVERVLIESIDLRNVLEDAANKEKQVHPNVYIRPIVLFQAQPKGKDENVTFEKIKENLISCGIPANQIAIKTSKLNEIKNVDLMSPDCKIRYIITVNALKEGWDCPFAYILASLANKSSSVDVEQILGRILRQPNTQRYNNKLLNMSYVLTSSADFQKTLNSILEGLNSAGFSKNDCRTVFNTEEVSLDKPETISLFDEDNNEADDVDLTNFNIETVTKEIKDKIKEENANDEAEVQTSSEISTLINQANQQSDEYELQIEDYKKEDDSGLAHELSDKMNRYKLSSAIKDFVDSIKLPQFSHSIDSSLFCANELISRDDLCEGFSLSMIEIPGDLTTSLDNVFKIDVESNDEGNVAKQFVMKKQESEDFKNLLQMIPEASRVNSCKSKLVADLNLKFKSIRYQDLVDYVERIVSSISNEDELIDLQNNIMSVEYKIKNFIDKKLEEYRYKKFKEDLNVGKIFLEESFSFPKFISPITSISKYSKTMYSEEDGDLTDVETDFTSKVSGLDNVVCWHRNIEKKGFSLNGYINHYPDFIILTESGKVILVETKGEHLANDDSKLKLELGKLWSSYAGQDKYKYFMAFKKNAMEEEGSYLVDKVIDIIKSL